MPFTKQGTWKNWAGNQSCAPAVVERPQTEDDLVRLVKDAAAGDRGVKVVGAGHSFTDIACTDGTLVDMTDYGRVLSIDTDSGEVTVQAGIALSKMNLELAAAGLAFENLGDITYQSLAGATSTATHGTGAQFRNISSNITGMRIVTGDGEVVDCSATENADLWRSARVGVGALGVVSTITLKTVPAFNLHAVEHPMRMSEVEERWDELADATDHFEFYWVPHTRWCLTKHNSRTQEPVRPKSKLVEYREDYLLSNLAFGAICRLGRWKPNLIPRLATAIPSAGKLDYIDHSYRVFASPRWVRFYEMEYALPREAGKEALARLRAFVDSAGLKINFPVEVRVTKGDDIPLSTASGRDTCYIAIHMFQGMQYVQYFQGFEAICNDYGGRPHWGKMHFQTHKTLADRYPQWDEFQAARARLDPDGRFTNLYTSRVLGPA